MWRPDNWEFSLEGQLHSNPRSIYEAGADAIIEALKKEGSYLNGDTIIPAIGEFPEIHCPGGMVGWVVFIPEEEEK